MDTDTRRILHNRAECSECGDVIESKHRHDFVRCKCGKVFTDGGRDYIRRGMSDGAAVIDRTVWSEEPEST